MYTDSFHEGLPVFLRTPSKYVAQYSWKQKRFWNKPCKTRKNIHTLCQQGTSESKMQIQLRGEYYEIFIPCVHFLTCSHIHDSWL